MKPTRRCGTLLPVPSKVKAVRRDQNLAETKLAYGSIIFLTDDKTTEKLQADFAAWAPVFPSFALHSSGAAQISTWAAVELLGLGAHLQHYNGYVKAALPEGAVPQEWTVQAQLVFGAPAAGPGEKTFIDNPVKILN